MTCSNNKPVPRVHARERQLRLIVLRQGQSKFRQSLLEAYEHRCAITNCDVQEALESAHIKPYSISRNNQPSNGLLLWADIHTLFDLYLIAIDPKTMTVRITSQLCSSYSKLHGKALRLPYDKAYWPKKEALKWRYEQCLVKNSDFWS